MLKKKPAGTFLVRVSESRFGYSLSHWCVLAAPLVVCLTLPLSFFFCVCVCSVSEGGRIKHYMIDQTIEGKYQVVGNRKLFRM